MVPIDSQRLNADLEFRRLLDLMPASARMTTKLISQPTQPTLLCYPRPWWSSQARTIGLNLQGWSELPMPQRDLLLLYAVSWQTQSQWLKPSLYHGLAAMGLMLTCVEGLQQDAVGMVTAMGLSAIATQQIWKQSQGVRLDLMADQAAIETAQRRGYAATEAAHHLLMGIAASIHLEHRDGPSFNELIRTQKLRTLTGLSQVMVPDQLDPF